jgi:hypothetical protein
MIMACDGRLQRSSLKRIASLKKSLLITGHEPLLALGCGAVGTGVAGGLLFPRTDIP